METVIFFGCLTLVAPLACGGQRNCSFVREFHEYFGCLKGRPRTGFGGRSQGLLF